MERVRFKSIQKVDGYPRAGENLSGARPVRIKSTQSIVLLLTALNLLNYIDRFVFAAVLPPISQELALSDVQGGILISVFIVVYSIACPIFGMLGDRSYRALVLAGAGVFWCFATGMTGTAVGFAALLLWRAMIGIGEAAFGSIGPAMIDERVERRHKSRVLGFFYLAIFLGAALGYIAGGTLQSWIGWRHTFFVLGFGGLPIALLAYTIEDKRETKTKAAPPLKFWAVQRELFSNRLYLFNVLGMTAWTFVVPAFSYWAPTYMVRELHYDLAAGNLRLGVLTVICGILGTLTGSIWSDRWAEKDPRAPLWVCAISVFPAAAAMLGLLMTHDVNVFWVLTAVTLFSTSLSMGPSNTVVLGAVPFAIRSSAMAASIFVNHWLGDVFSPTLVGWWSDHHGLRAALSGLPLVFLLSALCWLWAIRFVQWPATAVAKTTNEKTRQ
jgi:MFS family permease